MQLAPALFAVWRASDESIFAAIQYGLEEMVALAAGARYRCRSAPGLFPNRTLNTREKWLLL
jgi:hypothetical protein